jgi:hypothetical protein
LFGLQKVRIRVKHGFQSVLVIVVSDLDSILTDRVAV